MRINGRILFVLFGGSSAGVVLLLGCEVTESPSPPLENAIPNTKPKGGGTAGAGGGATTSSGGPGTLPYTLCECAGVQAATSGDTCTSCQITASSEGGNCDAEGLACLSDTKCAEAIACVEGCNQVQSCIDACVLDPNVSPAYIAVLSCTCRFCETSCPTPPAPSVCMAADGGTDGGADADASD
jgi:hypothetical protein